ncbi:MAG: thiopurine S-methyltransferase [Gammaproteobacteria bacterium]|nr:thiopurine S-methyltransferase [Gammaproteobacteria bacterium]MBU2676894.1 thiopurine S-methyltransferase [Gammaproteobacteria bacterium]NNC58277.1 thiopurine S-methyltransferase [Woeseiaceae bacterium]NNL50628.1 thiopurine S-methyltransferase [Woeseiaceae bacterium]
MTESWLERWQEGRTGWHESEGNASLRKHWTASGTRVLVPLCGKTQDLIWLERQGNDVTGVELSELAVRAFFDENEIAYSCVEGALTAYRANDRAITIYCGDYFSFSDGPFDAYYDRGALVALPADIRRSYVEHSRSLLNADATKLIISLEYDESIATGPPFSVPASEILEYWSELCRVDAYDDIENGPPKFRDAGLAMMLEVIWRYP